MPGLIDAAFGSGDPAAAEAAMAARGKTLGKRYDALRERPVTVSQPIDVKSLPAPFQQAVLYAQGSDVMRSLGSPARVPRPPKTDIGTALQNALEVPVEPRPPINYPNTPNAELTLGTLLSRNPQGQLQMLTPANILDIHHSLVMQAKPSVGGDPNAQRLAVQLKNWFSAWADQQLKGHEALRADYMRFKQMMEAQELAANLPINTGGANHPAMKFLAGLDKQRQAAMTEAERQYGLMEGAAGRYKAQARTTLPTEYNARIDAALKRADDVDEVRQAFSRAWGESLKDQLGRTGDPNTIVGPALSPNGQARILTVLGPEEGQQFINSLAVYEARNQGAALGLKAGGGDSAAMAFFTRAVQNGQTDVANTFRRAWGDRIRDELGKATTPAQVNSVVNALLSPEGKRRILTILGEDRGRMFIEALYNKQQAAKFGNTLYGNSNTAYKLARQQKASYLTNAIGSLMPWQFHPTEFLKNMRGLAQSAYAQRRADQGNALLSRQGPEDVGAVLDTILARRQLRTTGYPYLATPGIYAAGPISAAVPGVLDAYRNPRGRP
jgi:hypothetical protein